MKNTVTRRCSCQ